MIERTSRWVATFIGLPLVAWTLGGCASEPSSEDSRTGENASILSDYIYPNSARVRAVAFQSELAECMQREGFNYLVRVDATDPDAIGKERWDLSDERIRFASTYGFLIANQRPANANLEAFRSLTQGQRQAYSEALGFDLEHNVAELPAAGCLAESAEAVEKPRAAFLNKYADEISRLMQEAMEDDRLSASWSEWRRCMEPTLARDGLAIAQVQTTSDIVQAFIEQMEAGADDPSPDDLRRERRLAEASIRCEIEYVDAARLQVEAQIFASFLEEHHDELTKVKAAIDAIE